jgi:hypothetical protein
VPTLGRRGVLEVRDDGPPLCRRHHSFPKASCSAATFGSAQRRLVRDDALEPAVLLLERLEPLHVAGLHAPELLAPPVERVARDAVPPAHLVGLARPLGFLEHSDDLLVREPRLSHGSPPRRSRGVENRQLTAGPLYWATVKLGRAGEVWKTRRRCGARPLHRLPAWNAALQAARAERQRNARGALRLALQRRGLLPRRMRHA